MYIISSYLVPTIGPWRQVVPPRESLAFGSLAKSAGSRESGRESRCRGGRESHQPRRGTEGEKAGRMRETWGTSEEHLGKIGKLGRKKWRFCMGLNMEMEEKLIEMDCETGMIFSDFMKGGHQHQIGTRIIGIREIKPKDVVNNFEPGDLYDHRMLSNHAGKTCKHSD